MVSGIAAESRSERRIVVILSQATRPKDLALRITAGEIFCYLLLKTAPEACREVSRLRSHYDTHQRSGIIIIARQGPWNNQPVSSGPSGSTIVLIDRLSQSFAKVFGQFSPVCFSQSTFESPEEIHRGVLPGLTNCEERADGTQSPKVTGCLNTSRLQHPDRCRTQVLKLFE